MSGPVRFDDDWRVVLHAELVALRASWWGITSREHRPIRLQLSPRELEHIVEALDALSRSARRSRDGGTK